MKRPQKTTICPDQNHMTRHHHKQYSINSLAKTHWSFWPTSGKYNFN